MLSSHVIDADFNYVSKNLKYFLDKATYLKKTFAVDIPCGNGRNIFLLASHFNSVIGIDRNIKYLDEIKKSQIDYKKKISLASNVIYIIQSQI